MANRNISKYVDQRVHCPFGCRKEHHDEHMYCCHLVGFTSKGKAFEPIFRVKGRVQVRAVTITEDKAKEELTITPAFCKVLPDDVLVNPEYVQKDEYGTHLAKEWVSSRVYRDCSVKEAQEWRAKYVVMIEEDEFGTMLEVV